jgi:hypothetical protein
MFLLLVLPVSRARMQSDAFLMWPPQQATTEGALENPGGTTDFRTKPQERTTYGETLRNGTILDLVDAGDRDELSLLSWDGKNTLIRPVIDCDGISYHPPILHPSIRAAIRFPRGASGFGTTLELFRKVANACGQHLGLAEDWAAFATCAILSSWVNEILLMAVTLCVSGAFMQVCHALRLFGVLCRRALPVAELSRRLPFSLRPTLIVNDPLLKGKSDFWRAASCHGVYVAGSGSTLSGLDCAKVVVLQPAQSPLMWGPEAMFLPLPPADVLPLSDPQLAAIAAELQPQLEMFRLRLLSGVEPVVARSHPLARFELVRNLAPCIPADAEIVRALAPLLESLQQGLVEWGPHDPLVASLQAVWNPSHNQKQMSVGEITTFVNAILRSLGDIYEYNSREVGWKLRNLKLPTRSNGQRKVLRFSGENRSRIHRCVREFGLQLPFFDDCPDCKELQGTKEKPVE